MGVDDLATDGECPGARRRVRVAVDTGPLHGRRTGIGNAVAWTLDALAHRADLELFPYVLSTRAKITAPERRLPMPAALAHRFWMHRSPSLDRLLGRPDIVHGTNYVVPPTRCPQLVSVYDCWFLEHPDDVSDDVARSARLLRRAVGRGASRRRRTQQRPRKRARFSTLTASTPSSSGLPRSAQPPSAVTAILTRATATGRPGCRRLQVAAHLSSRSERSSVARTFHKLFGRSHASPTNTRRSTS